MPSFENQHMPNTRGPRSTLIHYTGAQNFHVKEISHTGPGIILLISEILDWKDLVVI